MSYTPVKKRIKNQVKKDLLAQLEAKGLTGEYYKNLVNDYMFLYQQKSDLQDDIQARGVIVDTVNSRGDPIEKKNESCDMILKTNQQMLKILDFLQITPSLNTKPEEDDEL